MTKRTTGILVAAVASMATAGAIVASAAVPTFPDNIVVFPDRDFVTIEGYQNHIGETGTVKVTRNGSVVGSAQGVVEEGDVAFEINHPGGYCWGAGTGLNVTPDIQPGDNVSISFGTEPAGDTTVQNAYATDKAKLSADGKTLTVRGYIGGGVNSAQMEQRIVNPDLVDTVIGRRDIRAVPGPLTPAPKGGYSSNLAFGGDEFVATYIFDDPAVAAIAAKGGGERAMTWEVEDGAANRQGLTIAELGELGGPGMGGCPAGPADQAAPQPGTAAVVRSSDKTQMVVYWTAATPAPGAAAVTGYSVQAISKTPSALGQATVGRRTLDSTIKTTITGLDPAAAYDVDVRSMAGARMSEAYMIQAPAAPAPGDQTAPNLSISPAGGTAAAPALTKNVTLSSTDTTQPDIYYTTDGKDVMFGGLPSDSAQLYTTAIPISKETTIKAVAYDRAGNTTLVDGVYKPPTTADPLPTAPTELTGTVGQGSVTLKWNSATTVSGYGVQAYLMAADGTLGAKVGALRETTAKTMTITPLTAGTDYMFTVKAKNAQGLWGPDATVGPLSPIKVNDTVTVSAAKWKAGDFRVVGTGSVPGAVVKVYGPTTPGGTTIDRTKTLGTQGVGLPVAPATVGDFDIRQRNTLAPSVNPGRIWIESSDGGTAGPVVVANG